MSSSAAIASVLGELDLLVLDDVGELLSGAMRDRSWVFEMDAHADADDLVPQKGRLRSALVLTGVYELYADDVDEVRAAHDAQAIALGLPDKQISPKHIVDMPDRDIVQADITARASLRVVFADEAGSGAQRDTITDASRALQLELARPERCTGRRGLDRLWLAAADVAAPGPSKMVEVAFEVRSTWRPGAGGSWAVARPAVIEAAEKAGLVVINDAGKPATSIDEVGISGRAQLRLQQLANARLTFDDSARRLVVEQTFDLIQEST